MNHQNLKYRCKIIQSPSGVFHYWDPFLQFTACTLDIPYYAFGYGAGMWKKNPDTFKVSLYCKNCRKKHKISLDYVLGVSK